MPEGLIPRITNHLFENITQLEASYAESPLPTSVKSARVEVSFFEIYKDEVYDLLSLDPSGKTTMLQHGTGRLQDRHLLQLKVCHLRPGMQVICRHCPRTLR